MAKTEGGVWGTGRQPACSCLFPVRWLWPWGQARTGQPRQWKNLLPSARLPGVYTSSLFPIGNLGWQTRWLSGIWSPGGFWQRKEGFLVAAAAAAIQGWENHDQVQQMWVPTSRTPSPRTSLKQFFCFPNGPQSLQPLGSCLENASIASNPRKREKEVIGVASVEANSLLMTIL